MKYENASIRLAALHELETYGWWCVVQKCSISDEYRIKIADWQSPRAWNKLRVVAYKMYATVYIGEMHGHL